MTNVVARVRAREPLSDPAADAQYLPSAQLKQLLSAWAETGGTRSSIVSGPAAIAPTFTPQPYPGLTHYEDGLPRQIAYAATLSDPDSPDFDGGSLTVSVNGATQYDQLNLQPPITTPPIVRVGNDVLYHGTLIGTASGGVNGAPLVIQFNAAATVEAVEWVVKSVTYRTTDQTTVDHWQGFTLVVNDGDGGTAQIQASVEVRKSNDPCVVSNFGGGQSLTYATGVTLGLDPGSDAHVTNIDTVYFNGGSLKVSIIDDKVAGEDVLGLIFGGRVTIAANNRISVDGVEVGILEQAGGAGGGDLLINLWEGATPDRVAVLLQHLTYTNSSTAPTNATKEIQVVVRDGDGFQVDQGDNIVGTDTTTTTVKVVVGTGILPPPVATVWPDGSILPDMPACPAWDPNWTPNSTQIFDSVSVAAGSYIYSVNGSTLFFHQYGSGTYPPFVNDGIVWVDGELPISLHTLETRFTVAAAVEVINHGVVVVRHFEQFNVKYGIATAFQLCGNVTNTGEIWTWCENGAARTITAENAAFVRNSGLIAARSENHEAVAIGIKGATVFNESGGKIMAEGVFAVAIACIGTNIENDGLILARSTHPGTASVGIQMGDADGPGHEVVNRGTIAADVAIYEVDIGFTPTQHPTQIVRNLTTGIINGDIMLALGADQVLNAGTINGYIFMGDDDDRIENSGIIVGNIDLGAGADIFLGGTIAEYVAGMDDADRLEGNGGNDQLMGGRGDDVLIGGVGNDGLFGEKGNDRIVTQDGDFVWGGRGDDRIELGDYRFEAVFGNDGFDTLVLPGGARVLDLTLVLASGAVQGFEKIILGGGKEIVVRVADVPALTDGGSVLWLDGTATDKIDLIGAWVAGATQVVDGVTWRRYDLDGRTVHVTVAATVQSSPPANAGGLDPFAGGEPAPVPGAGPLDFTQDYVFKAAWAFSTPLDIPYDETWWNDEGATVLIATGPPGAVADRILTNDGHIVSTRYDFTAGAAALGVDMSAGGALYNTKTIRAEYYYHHSLLEPEFELQSGTTRGVRGGNTVVNDGLIEVTAAHGTAIGCETPGTLANQGVIDVLCQYGFAFGVDAPGLLDNTGVIVVQGGYGATGVRFTGGNSGINAGFIGAVVTTAGESVGVSLKMANAASVFTFTNVGEIVADIAIRAEPPGAGTGQRPIAIVNNGILDGRIELGGLNDSLFNQGLITGAVQLGDGNDIFDGSSGTQSGGVFGGAGDDILTGGAEADLLVGGAGADVMDGGAGADRFRFDSVADSSAGSVGSPGTELEFAL